MDLLISNNSPLSQHNDTISLNHLCMSYDTKELNNIPYSFSRKVIWLEAAKTNKDSSVIAGYFLKAVKRYGNDVEKHKILLKQCWIL